MAYNGWSNYETWCVALWLDNEQGSYLECARMAQDVWDKAQAGRNSSREDVATRNLADSLQTWVNEMAPDLDVSMFVDLLGAALLEVNWYEIAKHYLSDVDKEDKEEEEETPAE